MTKDAIDLKTLSAGLLLGVLLLGLFFGLCNTLGLRSGYVGVPPNATPFQHPYVYDGPAAAGEHVEHGGH